MSFVTFSNSLSIIYDLQNSKKISLKSFQDITDSSIYLQKKLRKL